MLWDSRHLTLLFLIPCLDVGISGAIMTCMLDIRFVLLVSMILLSILNLSRGDMFLLPLYTTRTLAIENNGREDSWCPRQKQEYSFMHIGVQRPLREEH